MGELRYGTELGNSNSKLAFGRLLKYLQSKATGDIYVPILPRQHRD